MGSLFGGSKSKTENQAYGAIKGAFSPLFKYSGQGAGGISALLGGDDTGFNKYKSAVGYDWERDRGMDAIGSKYASIGGLDSGATLKGLAQFQSGLDDRYANTYLDKMLGLSNIGLSAGQLVTQAGQKSTSSSSPGIAGMLGKIGTAIATGGTSLATDAASTIASNPSIF